MIIEIEVEAKNEREWNVFQFMFAFSCNHLNTSWGRPSQSEKEGRACRGERDVVGILKIKLLRKRLMPIMLVVLATMAVTSVMVVMLKIAMTYLVNCQFTGTWRMHLILQVQVLPPTTFVLLLLQISIFYWKYLYIRFLIFLCYFFCIHGHPPHIMWLFYWISDNSISWICVKISIVLLR